MAASRFRRSLAPFSPFTRSAYEVGERLAAMRVFDDAPLLPPPYEVLPHLEGGEVDLVYKMAWERFWRFTRAGYRDGVRKRSDTQPPT